MEFFLEPSWLNRILIYLFILLNSELLAMLLLLVLIINKVLPHADGIW
jgi:hypothetical protein